MAGWRITQALGMTSWSSRGLWASSGTVLVGREEHAVFLAFRQDGVPLTPYEDRPLPGGPARIMHENPIGATVLAVAPVGSWEFVDNSSGPPQRSRTGITLGTRAESPGSDAEGGEAILVEEDVPVGVADPAVALPGDVAVAEEDVLAAAPVVRAVAVEDLPPRRSRAPSEAIGTIAPRESETATASPEAWW